MNNEGILPLGKCDWCGNSFQPNSINHRFCSILCNRKWHQKQSYDKHKEDRIQYRHDYYDKNKEDILAKSSIKFKEWYQQNKEKQIANVKRWRSEHPDKVREYALRQKMKTSGDLE